MLQIAARVGGWAGTPIGKAWEVGRGKLVKLVEAARPGVAAAAAGAVAAAVAVAAAASSATVASAAQPAAAGHPAARAAGEEPPLAALRGSW